MKVEKNNVTVFDVELNEEDLLKIRSVASLVSHFRLFKEDQDDETLIEIRVKLNKEKK